MKHAPPQKKKKHTTPTHDTCRATQPHLTQILVFASIFTTRMVLSAQEFYAIEKWQPQAWLTQGSRPRWACRSQRRSGGCRGSARRARWCRTNAWARRPEDCVATKSVFFFFRAAQNSDPETSHRAARRQTTPAFPKWAPTDPQVSPEAHVSFPKNLKWAPWLILLNVPQMVKKTPSQNEGHSFREKMHFCTVPFFPWARSTDTKTHA